MAILTTSGRVAMALSVAARPLHLAWGAGDPAWDALLPSPPPPPVASETALLAEFGRRAAPSLTFVMPDSEGGEISLPNGRWTATGAADGQGGISGTPSNHLLMRFAYDFTDGEGLDVRELGVFVGTVIKPAVLAATPGKLYFAPADIQSPGTLLSLERMKRLSRAGNVRQAFSFVLTL
jgi:hypothetical protein